MGHKDLIYSHPWRPARRAFELPPTSCPAFPRRTSLVPSGRVSSLLSDAGRTDINQSGLRCSVLSSATQILAYLPCRIGRYVNTFPFGAGGGVCKKLLRPQDPQKLFSPQEIIHKLEAISTSDQGAFLCCLKTIPKLQVCFGLILASFTRRRPEELRTGSIVLRPEALNAARASCFAARATRRAAPGTLPAALLPEGLRFSGPSRR